MVPLLRGAYVTLAAFGSHRDWLGSVDWYSILLKETHNYLLNGELNGVSWLLTVFVAVGITVRMSKS